MKKGATTSLNKEELQQQLKRERSALVRIKAALKIEAALERVRTVAMAIKQSDDLLSISEVVYHELIKLGFSNIRNAQIAIKNDEKKTYTVYEYSEYSPGKGEVAYTSSPIVEALYKELGKTSGVLYQKEFSGRKFEDWRKWRKGLNTSMDSRIDQAKSMCFYLFSMGTGHLGISTFNPITKRQVEILKRFKNVFELSYQRYTDVANAEAQAREAQIEAALERVRSKTMAMHNSQDVGNTVATLFDEFVKLGIETFRCGIGIIHQTKEMEVWTAKPDSDGNVKLFAGNLDMTIHPLLQGAFSAWEKNEEAYVYELKGDDLKRYFERINNSSKYSQKYDIPSLPSRIVHSEFYFAEGALFAFTLEELSAETVRVFKRFAGVFGQTYRRYLDLQKAEAQTRESQIQLALERVRARTMAMQASNELPEAANLLFQQIQSLGMPAWSAGYCTWDEDKKAITLWMSSEGVLQPPFRAPLTEDPSFMRMLDAHERGETFFVDPIGGEELVKHYKYMRTLPVVGEILDSIIEAGHPLPLFQINHLAYFSQGFLLFITYEPVPAAHDIFKRFGKVFDQTYTRFLDLNKAEAQARESQIQLALERIRARTMAMQKSDELAETASLLFKQLLDLGVGQKQIRTCAIVTFHSEKPIGECWLTKPNGDIIPQSFMVPYDKMEAYKTIYSAWKNGEKFHIVHLAGSELLKHLNNLKEYTDIPTQQFQDVLEKNAESYTHALFFSQGYLYIISSEPLPEYHDIFKQFGNVFEQTYTRFLDLKRAESQAKEAKIEAALERVRARSMAMHHSTELHEVADVLFRQLKAFGGDILNAGIVLCDPDADEDEYWISSDSGIRPVISIPHTEEPVQRSLYEGWKNKLEFYSVARGGDDLTEHYNYMLSVPSLKPLFDQEVESNRAFPTWQKWHAAYFAHGYVFLLTLNEYQEEKILVRFAKIFDQAYTRFLDLQKAEKQARESQIEAALEKVRSRTMAMQRSDELSSTAAVLFQEFKKLGEEDLLQITIAVYHEAEGTMEFRVTSWAGGGEQIDEAFNLSMDEPTLLKPAFTAWKEQKKSVVIDLKGKELEGWLRYRNEKTGVTVLSRDTSGRRAVTFAFFSKGHISFSSPEPRPTETVQLLERFASVFDLTYTRFLDLKTAEAQAREARIESSLERVRSKTMAMHNSNDVGETVATVFAEFINLGIHTNRCGILIFNGEQLAEVWTARSTPGGNARLIIGNLDLDAHQMLRSVYNAWKAKQKFYQYDLLGNDLKLYYTAINNSRFYPTQFDLNTLPPKEFHSDFFFADGALFSFTNEPVGSEHATIFRRFAGVFGQTYRRYLDLQRAEAQAREARIETSLERVRSKTIAMHSSQDVADTVATMFDEQVKLGVETIRCGIGIMHDGYDMEVWTAKPDDHGKVDLIVGHLDMAMHPLLRGAYDSWEDKQDFYTYELVGDDLIAYFTAINNHPGYPMKYDIATLPGRIVHTEFHFAEGTLFVFSLEVLPAETSKIFKRFAGVFGQTYRRYLDLQKAEAQARQAQVEAAMEKVRSRALAMQKPSELVEVAQLLRREMSMLGVEELETSSIYIHNEETGKTECWYAIKDINHPDKQLVSDHMAIDLDETWVGRMMLDFFRSGNKQISIPMRGENRTEWINYCANHSKVLTGFYGDAIPDRIYHLYKFSNGYMGAASPGDISSESWDLLQRATSVFSFAYTRFSDLQQAEALAREATIEAALERVRGRAMAMHNSHDLSSTASIIFTELRKLGINPIRCGVGLLSKESRKAQLYSATSSAEGDSLSVVGWVVLSGHPVMEKIYKSWEENQDYFPELTGDQLRSYYELLLSGLAVAVPNWQAEQVEFGHFIPFTVGCLYAWSDHPYDEAELKILKRFATIVDLTFRRYIDLQRSEASARDAVKQAALDRVRADIASMRTVADLEKITPLIWNELTILGIPFIRCGVFIMDETQSLIHTFLSTPDGKAIAAFHIPFDTPGNIGQVVDHWQKKKNYIDHWNEVTFREFADTLVKQGALESADQYLQTIPHGGFYLHFLPFLQGMLYVGNTVKLSEEETRLIQSVAEAFSTAYARYEDFTKLETAKQTVEKTLTDLKQAQTQLVQSEKMASLGELTAGIAHEIQNPLNFVNNFSDVSNELLDEMKTELEKGNKEDAMAIVEDVKQNLEKILHHGRRADAIVKGMLQHSRSSTGQKESTDINLLADEYLRLAYHGLRAKDKSFNAKFETEFDPAIGKINIIPQEIGRVILNLINNAFYAVSERQKAEGIGYRGTVSVSTTKTGERIEIRVADNGKGIPASIKDKIFQPFFTTKPTGQGTGLGLSLAYDIIKAHDGEIRVETKEGMGSEFIVQLPGNKNTSL